MELGLGAVVVTGAASGIGSATARFLATEGASVYAWDVDATRLAETVTDIRRAGGQATGTIIDVTSSDAVAAGFAAVRADGVDVTGVVNVAGLQRSGVIDEQSRNDWDAQIAVNLTGTWILDRHAVAEMKAPGGAIVNMASLVSRV